MINPEINQKLDEIREILTKNKVEKAYLFGSVCTDKFNDKSDVDIIISFPEDLDPLIQGKNWWDILFSLEDTLNKEIDLLTERSITNSYLKAEIDSTKVEIL